MESEVVGWDRRWWDGIGGGVVGWDRKWWDGIGSGGMGSEVGDGIGEDARPA